MPAILHPEATPGAIPETPQHSEDTRLDESQAVLEVEEDPRIPDGNPLPLGSLPVEAEIRAADED